MRVKLVDKKRVEERNAFCVAFARLLKKPSGLLRDIDQFLGDYVGVSRMSMRKIRGGWQNLGDDKVAKLRRRLGSKCDWLDPSVLGNPNGKSRNGSTRKAKKSKTRSRKLQKAHKSVRGQKTSSRTSQLKISGEPVITASLAEVVTDQGTRKAIIFNDDVDIDLNVRGRRASVRWR